MLVSRQISKWEFDTGLGEGWKSYRWYFSTLATIHPKIMPAVSLLLVMIITISPLYSLGAYSVPFQEFSRERTVSAKPTQHETCPGYNISARTLRNVWECPHPNRVTCIWITFMQSIIVSWIILAVLILFVRVLYRGCYQRGAMTGVQSILTCNAWKNPV